MWSFCGADLPKKLKKASKVIQLKNKTIKEEKKECIALIFWSALTGYCIDRLQPFQCLIFVAVCRSIASFSTSVLHFSQSLHVVNVISQCFNKLNSLFAEISSLFVSQGATVGVYTTVCLNLNCSNSGGSGTQWWHSGQTILHARETAVHPQEVQWGAENSGLDKKDCGNREIGLP